MWTGSVRLGSICGVALPRSPCGPRLSGGLGLVRGVLCFVLSRVGVPIRLAIWSPTIAISFPDLGVVGPGLARSSFCPGVPVLRGAIQIVFV